MHNISFKEFVTLQRGFDLPKSQRGEGSYPVVGATTIDGFHSEYKVAAPGVVTGRSGALGEVQFIGEPFWPLNTTLWVKDFKGNHPSYVCYFLKTLDLKQFNSGAGVPTLNRNHLDTLPVTVHDPPVQRKIAAILSAYDDLIENNSRRIRILEEMAQATYREWFVHFRFPGHAKVKLVDSPRGKIPQGWQDVRFSQLLESGLGGDWGVDEPNDEENAPVLVIRGTDFNDIVKGATLRTPKRFIAPSSQAKRQLRAGDLLVENSINAKSRCVGTTLLITDGVLRRLSEPAIAASFCKVYRFKDLSIAPLAHLHMRHLYADGGMAFYQNVAANGIGNFQSQRFLESEHLVFPSDSKRWQEMFGFLQDLTSSTLADQIFKLHRTRDLLLPKLISGEVDVSGLDLETGDVAP